MQKQTIQFAVETKNGVVQRIGKSTIYQPKANPNPKGIKWFDDRNCSKKTRNNPG